LAFEHGDLLAESEDLQGGIASGTEENAECTQHSDENCTMNSVLYHNAAPD
jgi:hypothetical protein